MKKNIRIFLLLCILIPIGCSCQTKKGDSSRTNKSFTLPEVPATLKTPDQRAAYIVAHYWNHFDFADTTLIAQADITEQAFVDFLYLFPHVSSKNAHAGLRSMLSEASVNTLMFQHFAELCEKYLYEPDSPCREEELYITVLKKIIKHHDLEEEYKIRPRYQLEQAMRNRPGDIAAPLPELLRAKGAHIVLFFANPHCADCRQAKEYITAQGIDQKATIVMVNPDEHPEIDSLYTLRTIPTFYLLDNRKRVLLKDVSIEEIQVALQK